MVFVFILAVSCGEVTSVCIQKSVVIVSIYSYVGKLRLPYTDFTVRLW